MLENISTVGFNMCMTYSSKYVSFLLAAAHMECNVL